MQQIRRFMASFSLAATMIVPVGSAGCAARARYYDAGTATIIGGTREKTALTAAIGTNATDDRLAGRN